MRVENNGSRKIKQKSVHRICVNRSRVGHSAGRPYYMMWSTEALQCSHFIERLSVAGIGLWPQNEDQSLSQETSVFWWKPGVSPKSSRFHSEVYRGHSFSGPQNNLWIPPELHSSCIQKPKGAQICGFKHPQFSIHRISSIRKSSGKWISRATCGSRLLWSNTHISHSIPLC